MEFSQFVKKNKINLSDKEKSFCLKGLEIMKQSVDPTHDIRHVESIIGNFDQMLRNLPKTLTGVDKKVVLISICWHDSWKATTYLDDNFFGFMVGQLWDGMGSNLLFRFKARKSGLNKNLINRVAYSIKKHSFFQIIPPMTKEANVLKDVDNLEIANHTRVFGGEKFKFLYTNPFFRLVLFFYFKYTLYVSLRFDWTRQEFKRRLPEVYKQFVISGR